MGLSQSRVSESVEFVISNGVLKEYNGPGGDVKIPEAVTEIADKAFARCSSLASVVIPDSVTEICEHAFDGCSSLTSVVIPNGVTKIGERAFSGCSSFNSVEIPASVTTIGAGAFYGCSSLRSVEIPASMTTIGVGAFQGCSRLISVVIPASVTTIGMGAFYGCSSLSSVVIPASVTEIDALVFSGCSSLRSVEIPARMTTIGKRAFSNCGSLISMVIPGGVTEIGGEVFQGCSSLASVLIPDSVTKISARAFADCTSLTAIELPASVTSIGGNAFDGCTSLTAIELPKNLKEIELPENLEEIELPENLEEIGVSAFDGCTSLKVLLCAQDLLDKYGNNIIPQGVLVLDHDFEPLRLPQGMDEEPPKPKHFLQMSYNAKLMYYLTAVMGEEWSNMQSAAKINFIRTTNPAFTTGELKQLDLKLYQSFIHTSCPHEENILATMPLADVLLIQQAVCPNSDSKVVIDFSWILAVLFNQKTSRQEYYALERPYYALERRSSPQTIRSFLLFCHRIEAAGNGYLANHYRPIIAASKGLAMYVSFMLLTEQRFLPKRVDILNEPLPLPVTGRSLFFNKGEEGCTKEKSPSVTPIC